MTLVRFNQKPGARSFNNLMDDFFTGMPSLLRDDFAPANRTAAPVNIRETEKDFVLELVVPGFTREELTISVDKHLLTVSAEVKASEEGNEKQIRNEYIFRSFRRSFNLDEKIDAENIVAKYLNGVLTLNLPKKQEVKPATKQITIQ